MRTKIQLRLGDTSSTPFYSTALLNDVIDSRVLVQAGEIARLVPNFYVAHTSYTGATDALDSNFEFYSVPNDFSIFIKLERQFGTGQNTVFQTIRTVNFEDQDRYRIGFNLVLLLPDSMQNFQQTVSLWGDRFRLIPPPQNSSYLYRMRYLRQPIATSSDSTVLDIPAEWIEFITLDCAEFIFNTAGDPLADKMNKLKMEEFTRVRRFFRRHSFGNDVMGTLDRMQD